MLLIFCPSSCMHVISVVHM